MADVCRNGESLQAVCRHPAKDLARSGGVPGEHKDLLAAANGRGTAVKSHRRVARKARIAPPASATPAEPAYPRLLKPF